MKEEKEKLPVDETKKSGEVTRRDFLVGAGTVVVGGAIGAGLLSSCGETVTTTVKETSTKTVPTTITAPGTTVTETKTVAGEDGQVITVTETKTVHDGGGGILPADEPEETTLKVGCSDGRALSAVDTKHGKIQRQDLQFHNEESSEPLFCLLQEESLLTQQDYVSVKESRLGARWRRPQQLQPAESWQE